MRFPEVTVCGTPFEMGYAFGKSVEYMIRALLAAEATEDAAAKALSFQPLYERFCPDLLEEAKGIAQALNISLGESLFLQTRWDLNTVSDGQCTSFACTGAATSDGRIFAGMNKDVPAASREMMVLLHMCPATGPRKLLIAYPGSMAGPGMNEYGVCFFGNSLYGGRIRKNSIPQPMMMRLILQQQTAAAAKDCLLAIHAEGHIGFNGNATICDAQGDMYCVEMFGDQIAVAKLEPGEDFLVHANNLITQIPSMLELETPELSGNTFGRTERMKLLFAQQRGKLTEDTLKEILRDHEGAPFGICRHNGCLQGRVPSHTAMSCVALPAEGRIWFCKGNPCENPYFLHIV